MHDIGRFVLFDADPEELNKVDDSGWATPEDLVEAERDLLGFDHAALAWLVCQHWCIPDHVSEIVRDHHEYEEDCASRDADTKTRVIGIIQIADLLSTSGILQETGKRTEQELSRLITERCLHPCWLNPPIEPRRLAASCAEIAEESQKLIDGLGLAALE